MDYRTVSKRLAAAADLLQKRQIDKSAIDSLRNTLRGIHPSLDKHLDLVSKQFTHLEHLQKGDVVSLVTDALPDVTPEQKKRKKALLLFVRCWNDLKSEVSRVQKEIDKQHTGQNPGNTIANILAATKGPLGIITVLAVGIVALKVTEVSVVVQNKNCDPIAPATHMAITIPGLSVPQTIPTGGEAVIKIPPVSLSVNATSPSEVQLTMYGIKYNFPLGNENVQLVFDGKPLNGGTSDIHLASQKQHALVVQCK